MPVPELVRRSAVRQLREYCERRVPPRARHQVRLEVVDQGNTLTIVERRAPWRPDLGPEWSSHGVARFRYEPRPGKWSLFWVDRHGRWHRYKLAEPAVEIGSLLAEVERDPTNIFWG
jgi:hypothetical protein